MTNPTPSPSPIAAKKLLAAITDEDEPLSPFEEDADYYMGATDCTEGCVIEPDGTCPHGYVSAAITAHII